MYSHRNSNKNDNYSKKNSSCNFTQPQYYHQRSDAKPQQSPFTNRNNIFPRDSESFNSFDWNVVPNKPAPSGIIDFRTNMDVPPIKYMKNDSNENNIPVGHYNLNNTVDEYAPNNFNDDLCNDDLKLLMLATQHIRLNNTCIRNNGLSDDLSSMYYEKPFDSFPGNSGVLLNSPGRMLADPDLTRNVKPKDCDLNLGYDRSLTIPLVDLTERITLPNMDGHINSGLQPNSNYMMNGPFSEMRDWNNRFNPTRSLPLNIEIEPVNDILLGNNALLDQSNNNISHRGNLPNYYKNKVDCNFSNSQPYANEAFLYNDKLRYESDMNKMESQQGGMKGNPAHFFNDQVNPHGNLPPNPSHVHGMHRHEYSPKDNYSDKNFPPNSPRGVNGYKFNHMNSNFIPRMSGNSKKKLPFMEYGGPYDHYNVDISSGNRNMEYNKFGSQNNSFPQPIDPMYNYKKVCDGLNYGFNGINIPPPLHIDDNRMGIPPVNIPPMGIPPHPIIGNFIQSPLEPFSPGNLRNAR